MAGAAAVFPSLLCFAVLFSSSVFLFPLSTMSPLCSGFMEVLVAAAWGADSGRSTVPSSPRVFLLSFSSLFLFSFPRLCLVASLSTLL